MYIEVLFWICTITILYHYILFPLAIFIIARWKGERATKGPHLPNVSIVIAAYNEEVVIREKLRNSIKLDYPEDKREIIVVSDGSTDNTEEIVKSFKSSDVISLHRGAREGKSKALNHGVELAGGEVILFTDANAMLRTDALRKLVANFTDSKVGGVSGRKVVLAEGQHGDACKGDGAFWKVESKLKAWESAIGSIPTGDGEIFAIRRKLFRKLPSSIINDDSAITMDIINQGQKVIYEHDAISSESSSLELKDDFHVKARIVYGGLQSLYRYRDLLFERRPAFALQFISHKTLRHVMYIFLAALLIFSFYLSGPYYRLALILQLLFYTLAFVGYLRHRWGKSAGILYYPMYYCMVNLAAAAGTIYFVTKRSQTDIWKKAVREEVAEDAV